MGKQDGGIVMRGSTTTGVALCELIPTTIRLTISTMANDDTVLMDGGVRRSEFEYALQCALEAVPAGWTVEEIPVFPEGGAIAVHGDGRASLETTVVLRLAPGSSRGASGSEG